MDRGKRPTKHFGTSNNKIYLDLKDIIRENAMPYFPAKTLFRFQTVCRDWKHQISTPFFAHNQSHSCRCVLGFFCQAPDGLPSLLSAEPSCCGVPDPSLSFLPEPVHIRSSTNGLLCCQGTTGDKPYYVCNPVLKQWKKIPKPNANHGSQPAIVLVFEPSLLNFEIDFKLICAFPSNDFDDATEFEIYSSKEQSWKISAEISFANLKIDPKSGIYAKGVVYWQAKTVIAYDLEKDRCQLLGYHAGGTLGTIDGELCSASIMNRTVSVRVLGNVYSNTMPMSSRSSLWKNEMKATLDKDVFGENIHDLKVVGVCNNLLLIGIGGRLYSYDFEAKVFKALTGPCEYSKMICLPYVNSLASLL